MKLPPFYCAHTRVFAPAVRETLTRELQIVAQKFTALSVNVTAGQGLKIWSWCCSSLFMRSPSGAIEEEDEAEAKLNSIQKGQGTVCLGST